MSLFTQVWRGRVRLWVTYWLWGVGGNMTFLVLLVLLGLGRQPVPAPGWLGPVYLLSLAWFVFVFVAIWRSAGRYSGPRLWAVLARVGVMVGIVRMLGEAVVLVFQS